MLRLRRLAIAATLAALVTLTGFASSAHASYVVRLSNGTDEGTGRLVIDHQGTNADGTAIANLTVINAWYFSFDALNDGMADDAALVTVDPSAAAICTPTDSNARAGDNAVTCDMTVADAFDETKTALVYLGDGATSS